MIAVVFKVELPAQTLLEFPTIASLAQRIESRRTGSTGDSPIVPIQIASTSTLPVLILPGGSGNADAALIFARLARHLGRDCSVYALHHCDSHGEPGRFESPQGLISYYARAARSLLAGGPCLIVGDCIASLLALELARDLRASGQRVSLLLLDPPRPGWRLGLRLTLRPYQDELAYHLATLRNLSPSALIRELLGKLARLPHRLGLLRSSPPAAQPAGPQQPQGHSARLKRCFAAYRKWVRACRPQPYDGAIEVLINSDWARSGSWRAWQKLARGGFRLHLRPGDHTGHYRQYAPLAAEHVRRCLSALGMEPVDGQVVDRDGASA